MGRRRLLSYAVVFLLAFLLGLGKASAYDLSKLPVASKGGDSVVVFSFDNNTNAGDLNCTLSEEAEIVVKLPAGVTFAEAPTLKSVGDGVKVYLNDAYDTEAQGDLVSDATAKWVVANVNDATSTGWAFEFHGKIQVSDSFSGSQINATVIIDNGAVVKSTEVTIAYLEEVQNPKLRAGKDDAGNFTLLFETTDAVGNYTIELDQDCVKFGGVLEYNATGNGTTYVSVANAGLLESDSSNRTIYVTIDETLAGVQVGVNATIVASDCPVGEITATVYDPNGSEVKKITVTEVAEPGTTYSVPETLPELTKGSEIAKTFNFTMTENFADDLYNGVEDALKLVFEGVSVNSVKAYNGTDAEVFKCTYVSDSEVLCGFNGTNNTVVEAITLVVNATVPYDYEGNEVKVTISDNNETDDASITSATLTVAKVVDPKVEVTSSPIKVSYSFNKCNSFNVTEVYYGSLDKGGQLVIFVPDELKDKVEIVNATLKSSEAAFSDADGNATNDAQAYVSYDQSNAYWVVQSESDTGNATYQVTVCLSTKEGVELEDGQNITLTVKYNLSNGELDENTVDFGEVTVPASISYETYTVESGSPSYQTIGKITIVENYADALTNGTIRIVVTGVSDVKVESEDNATAPEYVDYTDGKIAVFKFAKFDDPNSVENATIVLKGVVVANEVKVKLLDGNLDGEDEVGIGDQPEKLIAAVCDAEHLNFCVDQESCEGAGGYWYNDTCNAEPQIICDAEHLGNCTTEEECTNAGGYWCNGICQAEECVQPEPVPSEHKAEMNAEVNTGGVSVGEDAADGVVGGNETLSIKIEFPTYAEPVDVYVAFAIPGVGAVFVKSDKTAVLFDGETFVPYAENATEIPSVDFGSIPVKNPLTGQCMLPAGDYTVCTLVVPAGTSVVDFANGGAGELTCYQFRVECE